jgi:glycosyltransferase involved in cell wall biosynthesis
VPHDELVSFINGADVGFCLIENVSLSDYYCLPNKLFEYIFAGVKVIASDFPELRDMCERYKLGVVWDEKVEDISELIPKLNLLGKIDCEFLYDFSWEFQEKKLKSLYKNIINNTL